MTEDWTNAKKEKLLAENAKLRKDNELYLTILDGINECIYAIDENDKITLYNKRSEEVEGCRRSEMLGRDEKEVYCHDPVPYYTLVTEKIKTKQKPITRYAYAYHTQNGRYINVAMNAFPFMYENKYSGLYMISHTLKQTRDVMTEIRSLQKLMTTTEDTPTSTRSGYIFDDILGESPKIKETINLAKRVALRDSAVMIIGETGTGKELFAQGIHEASTHGEKPFVPINCAAIPDNLLESTLFGTVKGAFTGAVDMPGLFEQAEDGTIFLDEINSMHVTFQAKLLRAVQEKRIRRIGSQKEIDINCRVISATNTDLREESANFRTDLLFRLSVVTLRLPPLQERQEDVLLLAKHFVHRFNQRFHTNISNIDEELQRIFYIYDWPGNVRELENTIESAMNFVDEYETTLDFDHFPEYYKEKLLTASSRPRKRDLNHMPLREVLRNCEKCYILDALEDNHWNITRAARQLGIQRPNLYTKIKEHNIKRP